MGELTALKCDECGKTNESVSYDHVYKALLCDSCYDKLEDNGEELDL